MERNYLLKKDKLMLGPFSLQKLKEKQLKPGDLVWYDGLPDWVPADNIEELQFSEITQPLSPNKKVRIRNIIRRLFTSNK